MDKWTVGEGRLFRLAGDSVLIMCAGRGLSITIGDPWGSVIMQQDLGGGRALHPCQWGTWVASPHPLCSRRPLSREGAEMSSNNENTTTTTTVGLCFANPFCVIPGRPGGGGGLRELTALPLGPVTEILDVLTGSPCSGRGGPAPLAPLGLPPAAGPGSTSPWCTLL